MTPDSFADLSDADVIVRVKRAAERERLATAELIALLAECDARRLYLGEGCSSLFTYCTQVLHLSEAAAYGRITAARAARRWPAILRLGQWARVATQPITESAPGTPSPPVSTSPLPVASVDSSLPGKSPVVAPLAPDRYLIRVTVNEETHQKLERARSLLRHVIPNGDVATVLNRALTLLVNDLERTRLAVPRRSARAPRRPDLKSAQSRRVSAAVKREVWARDGGRCGFVGNEGRCQATSFLEFHHVVPYARGGPTSVENLQLRCRSHNQFEAIQFFGALTPTQP